MPPPNNFQSDASQTCLGGAINTQLCVIWLGLFAIRELNLLRSINAFSVADEANSSSISVLRRWRKLKPIAFEKESSPLFVREVRWYVRVTAFLTSFDWLYCGDDEHRSAIRLRDKRVSNISVTGMIQHRDEGVKTKSDRLSEETYTNKSGFDPLWLPSRKDV